MKSKISESKNKIFSPLYYLKNHRDSIIGDRRGISSSSGSSGSTRLIPSTAYCPRHFWGSRVQDCVRGSEHHLQWHSVRREVGAGSGGYPVGNQARAERDRGRVVTEVRVQVLHMARQDQRANVVFGGLDQDCSLVQVLEI